MDIDSKKILAMAGKETLKPGDLLVCVFGAIEPGSKKEQREFYWQQLSTYCYAKGFSHMIVRYS